MTNDMRPGKASLREEAAGWFALMRGPDADARKSEFDAWMAADALHRDAYNRIGETFSLGKALKRLPDGALAPIAREASPAVSSGTALRAFGAVMLAAVMVFATLLATTMVMRRIGPASGGAMAAQQVLVTSRGEIRTFTLADGSRVTLDTDSRVAVSLSSGRRDLELARGRARFAVAHEPRRFVVAAAEGSVTARGTVFDVTLDKDRGAVVDLIEGAVDVRADRKDAPRPVAGGHGDLVRLTAGHSLAFGGSRAGQGIVPFAKADWPNGLRDFKAVRLDALVADANRYGRKPLVLESGDLAGIQVSGTFSVRDSPRLARNLAVLLDLSVHEEAGRIVLAQPRESVLEKNLRPPS
jgi:transmembrane sensor